MTSPKPPRRDRADDQEYDQDETSQADIIAEQIEADYDAQSDAAVKSLVSDPASSHDIGDEEVW
jgi:hypothetical protein